MVINRDNLAAHELIGLKMTVAHSPDPSLRGLAGLVRDETRNTLQVELNGRLVRVSKNDSSLVFELPDGESATVEGWRLKFRPEDRVKKGLAKW